MAPKQQRSAADAASDPNPAGEHASAATLRILKNGFCMLLVAVVFSMQGCFAGLGTIYDRIGTCGRVHQAKVAWARSVCRKDDKERCSCKCATDGKFGSRVTQDGKCQCEDRECLRDLAVRCEADRTECRRKFEKYLLEQP